MDRSQLRKIGIWLISLYLSISPFWSVSETENEFVESPETAFDALDENVQDELVFKRLMIEAIDTSLEINSALGFDSSSTFQRAAVLVPAYAVIRGTYFAQRGLLSDIKRITPEKRRSTGGVFKESKLLVRTLLDKEQALKNAETRLKQLRIQAAEQIISVEQPVPKTPQLDKGTVPDGAGKTATVQQTPKAVSISELMNRPISIPNKVTAVQAAQIRNTLANNGIASFGDLVQKTPSELSSLGLDQKSIDAINNELDNKGLTLADEADKTAVAPTEEGKTPAVDADKTATAQADEGRTSTRRPTFAEKARAQRIRIQERLKRQSSQNHNASAGTPAQTAEQNTARPTPANSAQQAVQQQMIEKQEGIVRQLETETSTAKANLRKAMNVKLKGIFYRGGRLIRNLGFLTIGLAGIPVYVAAVGETAIVVFDLPEDMKHLREQYVQDIEEVITAASR